MASRKRQLLDVLRAQHRAQHGAVPLPAPAEAPRLAANPVPNPVPPPARSKPRSLPSWLPMALRWGFGLLWIILIFWLISLLWPDAESLKPGSSAQGAPAASPAAPPQAPAAAANPPPAASAASYGILAITYQGTSNEQQATSIAVQLRDQLQPQPQPVQVRKHIDEGKTWYEVFIGQAAAKADLKNLLEQVRGLSLPSQPGKKPFNDAYITRIPKTTS